MALSSLTTDLVGELLIVGHASLVMQLLALDRLLRGRVYLAILVGSPHLISHLKTVLYGLWYRAFSRRSLSCCLPQQNSLCVLYFALAPTPSPSTPNTGTAAVVNLPHYPSREMIDLLVGARICLFTSDCSGGGDGDEAQPIFTITTVLSLLSVDGRLDRMLYDDDDATASNSCMQFVVQSPVIASALYERDLHVRNLGLFIPSCYKTQQ